MEKTSLQYLQVHTDIEKIIETLSPDLLQAEQNEWFADLNDKRKKLLPAWLFVEAVEQTPVAISITDKKANILYVNQAFCDVTGYQPEEVIGQNESLLSYKSTPRSVYYDLWHSITRNETWEGQVLNRHKSGNPYLAKLTIVPIQDSTHNIRHYLGIHRDISNEYQTEKKLTNQMQLIESVINASPVAMAVLDEDRRVIMDNQQYKKMVSDLGQKEPASFFMDMLAVELGNIDTYLEHNPEGFNQVELRIEDTINKGPLWFSCSGQLFQEKDVNTDNFFDDVSKNYLLLSISNITKQRQQQERTYLQSLQTMLAEEEQIRSIRETLLGTIHQVNQPLNQIQAAIQLMKQRGENGALLDLLNQLKFSCEETVGTLQYCVPEIAPTSTTAINLNQTLHEIISLSSSKFLLNGIVVDWQPHPTLPNILGAENKLRMLFKQLIDNAINALNNSKSAERNITLETYTHDKRVFVTVTDSGPGIPEELLGKIFQPFFTTQKAGTVGSGMGLVMAKEIVHQFDGMIEVDADYKQGCRFIVSFPVITHTDQDRYDS